MFGSEILDVAIGIVLVYLLLSLICSAINELIEAWLKKRAKGLLRGIEELLRDPNNTTGRDFVKEIYEHPLIYGLYKGNFDAGAKGADSYVRSTSLPSYIPSRNFASALLDVVLHPPLAANTQNQIVTQNQTGTGAVAKGSSDADVQVMSLQTVRKSVSDITDNGQVRVALTALLGTADNDVARARENIEAWYDSAMDRVSGWYKRRTQVIIFVIGLLVAIGVNADTITIGNSLSHDEALRGSLVAAAQEYAKNRPQNPADDPQQRVNENLAEIRKLGLPVGWDRSDSRTFPTTFGGWAIKVIGLLLTAVATTLGAPFWFDLLNKFMVVRSTVKPHEKSPEEKSED